MLVEEGHLQMQDDAFAIVKIQVYLRLFYFSVDH